MTNTDNKKDSICHLCGKKILGKSTREHVPPRQFFLSRIRKNENLNLITLPTHKKCNENYQKDEEYFFSLIAAMAIESRFGGELYYDLNNKFSKKQSKNLINRILQQFEREPSGIVLPKGKVALRYERGRIENVIWKILKGLYFIEYNKYLHDNVARTIELIVPGDKPPEIFLMTLANEKGRGKHKGLFDYKMMKITRDDEFNKWILHYWAFLLWDRVIFTIAFHDPDCGCNRCKGE